MTLISTSADEVITADKIAASSLYFNEITTPAKESSDGKKWFEVGYVLPSVGEIAETCDLSVDTPPEV